MELGCSRGINLADQVERWGQRSRRLSDGCILQGLAGIMRGEFLEVRAMIVENILEETVPWIGGRDIVSI